MLRELRWVLIMQGVAAFLCIAFVVAAKPWSDGGLARIGDFIGAADAAPDNEARAKAHQALAAAATNRAMAVAATRRRGALFAGGIAIVVLGNLVLLAMLYKHVARYDRATVVISSE